MVLLASQTWYIQNWICHPLNPKTVHTWVISTTTHPVCQARSSGNLLEFSVSLPSMSSQPPRLAVSRCQYLFNLFTYLHSLPHCPSWHHHCLSPGLLAQSPVLLLSHPFSTLSPEQSLQNPNMITSLECSSSFQLPVRFPLASSFYSCHFSCLEYSLPPLTCLPTYTHIFFKSHLHGSFFPESFPWHLPPIPFQTWL